MTDTPVVSGAHLAIQVLERLLRKGEVDKDRQRDITLPLSRIDEYPLRDAEQAKDFHAGLKLAEEQGAVRLEWRKHHEGHELQRLRLEDARALADVLGLPFLQDRVISAFKGIDEVALPDWCRAYLEKLEEAWRSGKTLYGLSLGDSERLPYLVKALNVLSEGALQESLDYRQFGARYLGDSKATKSIERALATIFRQRWKNKNLRDKDVMQALNIVPLAHPVLMRGPMKVGVTEPELNVDIQPYLGVADRWLKMVALTRKPDYILTIENLSSFNEYTEAVQDAGVVLYTGGYPTHAFQRFYQKIVTQASVPLYHWGDTDPHGFLILKSLQQQVPDAEIMPHLMDCPDGAPYSASKRKELTRIVPVNPSVDALLARVVERGSGLVEQEEVRALPPRIRNI